MVPAHVRRVPGRAESGRTGIPAGHPNHRRCHHVLPTSNHERSFYKRRSFKYMQVDYIKNTTQEGKVSRIRYNETVKRTRYIISGRSQDANV